MEKYFFNYNNIKYEFNLHRKKVKNINLRINTDGKISVSANNNVSIEKINSFIGQKCEWIVKNVSRIEEMNANSLDNEIYDGKKVFLIGKEYMVRIFLTDFCDIRIAGNDIVMSLKALDKSKSYYLSWLKKICMPVFLKITQDMLVLMEEEKVSMPALSIKNMKSRWGSCNKSKKRMSLNLQLIKADNTCIEYVILHELCHLIHSNHGPDFYGLLSKHMEDWKERKIRLNSMYKDGVI